MIIGAVGPAAMVGDASAWVEACRGIITNSGAEPFLYPHFPGCRQDRLPFFCDLLFRDQWCETIRDADLRRALALPIFEERLMAARRRLWWPLDDNYIGRLGFAEAEVIKVPPAIAGGTLNVRQAGH